MSSIITKTDRTKQWIVSSYFELAESLPLRKISLQKLCEHAGIHRSTFYYHFNSIQDLINNIYHYEVNIPVQELIRGHPERRNEISLTAMKAIYRRSVFWQKVLRLPTQDDFISYILCDTKQNWLVLRDSIMQALGISYDALTEPQRMEVDYITEYYCNAHFFVTLQWIKQGTRIPPEEFSNLIDQIGTAGYYTAMNGGSGIKSRAVDAVHKKDS